MCKISIWVHWKRQYLYFGPSVIPYIHLLWSIFSPMRTHILYLHKYSLSHTPSTHNQNIILFFCFCFCNLASAHFCEIRCRNCQRICWSRFVRKEFASSFFFECFEMVSDIPYYSWNTLIPHLHFHLHLYLYTYLHPMSYGRQATLCCTKTNGIIHHRNNI